MENDIALENNKKIKKLKEKLKYEGRGSLLNNLRELHKLAITLIRKEPKINLEKCNVLKSLFSKLDSLVYIEYINNQCELNLRNIISAYLKSDEINEQNVNTVLQYLEYSKERLIKGKRDFSKEVLIEAYGFGNFNLSELAILNEIAALKKEPIKVVKSRSKKELNGKI